MNFFMLIMFTFGSVWQLYLKLRRLKVSSIFRRNGWGNGWFSCMTVPATYCKNSELIGIYKRLESVTLHKYGSYLEEESNG